MKELGDVIFIGYGPGNIEWNCYREDRSDEDFLRAAAKMRETLKASRERAGRARFPDHIDKEGRAHWMERAK